MKLAIFSDVHANQEALDAVLSSIENVDQVFCLGDVVGYGPDPDSCVATLIDRKITTVLGNHDQALTDDDILDFFNPDARSAVEWQRERIRPETLEWLSTLPRSYKTPDVTLVHGAPPDSTTKYLHACESEIRFAMGYVLTRICAVGHTHLPFVATGGGAPQQDRWRMIRFKRGRVEVDFERDQRVCFNPGSVGQPRDGYPEASYAFLDLFRNRLEVRRVQYDWSATQKKIREHGLPESLARRLEVGA